MVCRMRDKKSAADIHAALMRAEARLTFGSALPTSSAAASLMWVSGRRGRRAAMRPRASNSDWLNPRLRRFLPEERDRDGEQIMGQIRNGEDLIGQQCAERASPAAPCRHISAGAAGSAACPDRCRGQPPWRNRGRLARQGRHTVSPAPGGIGLEGLAAAGAEQAILCGEIVPAGGTDGQEGETGKREAADEAISGENDGGEAVEGPGRGTSKHANHGAPC